jgi:hypothetical protein
MQCLLGFVALILFLPQLSFKFYICANNPTWTHEYRCIMGASGVPADRQVASFTYEQCRPLSIDKRYDLKNLFVLAALDGANAYKADGAVIPIIFSSRYTSRCRSVTRPLRGPPCAILSFSALI